MQGIAGQSQSVLADAYVSELIKPKRIARLEQFIPRYLGKEERITHVFKQQTLPALLLVITNARVFTYNDRFKDDFFNGCKPEVFADDIVAVSVVKKWDGHRLQVTRQRGEPISFGPLAENVAEEVHAAVEHLRAEGLPEGFSASPIADEEDASAITHERADAKKSQSELTFRGEVVGGWEILSGRVQRAAQRQMDEDERVLFCLRGDFSHSLIAFEDRVLIVKPGILAGTAFGALTATFYYRDITGFELNTGLATAVLEVSTPSYQATARRSWVQSGSLNDHDRDPYRVSNCVPLYRRSLSKYEAAVAQLRAKLREVKEPPPPPSSGHPSVASELAKLAELHAAGVLSDEEFQRAKASIIG